MSSLHQFFAMGGYAAYVWSAYAVVFAAIIGNVFYIGHERKRIRQVLQKMMAMKETQNAD